MNWRKITAYAAALFVAQAAMGLFEGLFLSPGVITMLISCLASFVVCGSIFAYLSFRQPLRPFAHALAACVLQVALAVAFSQALVPWLGGIPVATVALEWLILSIALLVGTTLGLSARRSVRHPTDA